MKRVILILFITGIGVIASFIDAYYGLLLYTWYSFSSPLELTYGQLEGSRLSLLVGAVVVLTTLHQRKKIFFRHTISFLCLAFVFLCFCSLSYSGKFGPQFIFRELELVVKIVVICTLVPVLLSNLQRLRLYILVIAVSAGLLGAYYGVFGLMAGSRSIVGPGRIGDNNGYAVMLTGCLPFIFYAGRYLPKSFPLVLKNAAIFMVLFGNALAIVLTFSRGGFLAATLVAICLLSKLRSLLTRVLGWGLLLPIMFHMLWTFYTSDPNEWQIPTSSNNNTLIVQTFNDYLDRLATLRYDLQEEESAAGRIHFWKVALKMFQDRPVFGVGLNRYSHEYSKYDFSDGEYGSVRAVHNTFLSVLSETGALGFFVFIGIIATSIFSGLKARIELNKLGDSDDAKELSDYVSMVRISLLGYIVGGFFVTTLYQEIFWALVSISITIEVLARKYQNETETKAESLT